MKRIGLLLVLVAFAAVGTDRAEANAITGTVSIAGTGQPATRGSVVVYNAAGAFLGATLINSSNGSYAYTGLGPGTYFARTSLTHQIGELWDNIHCPWGQCTVTSGTPIVIGTTPVVANFSLEPGGTIAGTVTVEGTSTPVSFGNVRFYSPTGAYLGLYSIGSGGTYSAGGFASGIHYVATQSSSYHNELWDNLPCPPGNCNVTTGTPVTVQAPGVSTADFQLVPIDPIFGDGFQIKPGVP